MKRKLVLALALVLAMSTAVFAAGFRSWTTYQIAAGAADTTITLTHAHCVAVSIKAYDAAIQVQVTPHDDAWWTLQASESVYLEGNQIDSVVLDRSASAASVKIFAFFE